MLRGRRNSYQLRGDGTTCRRRKLAPEELRGSAFGLLAALQSAGNLAASAVAGLLWTLISPTAAFLYAAAWMIVALIGIGTETARR